MNGNDSSLEALLRENESSTLDFKREQYRFITNDDKGEFIKDILAFTNAWRHTDAYILIGVEENPGGRARILGVTQHLKDADLQQLVNSKTDQPITFSYRSERLDGKDIGILNIPVQNRPRFIIKPFAKLLANTVYIRRGSSTVIARPDEVAQMGTASTPQPSPTLRVQFANVPGRILNGDSLELEGTCIGVSDGEEIPDFQPERRILTQANTDYFRELVLYEWTHLLCKPVQFAITNSASVLATDIRVELSVGSREAVIFDEYSWPTKPEEDLILGGLRIPLLIRGKDADDIQVEELTDGNSIIKITSSKVQPKQTVWIDCSLFLGAKLSGIIPLNGMTWADNISSPQEFALEVNFATQNRRLTWKQFLEERKDYFVRQLLKRKR